MLVSMTIFSHDNHNMEQYIPWVQAHPTGYVVNFRWKGGKHLVVHRATDLARQN